jgi:hypothetical protein
MEIKVKPEQCIDLEKLSRFVNPRTFDLKPRHFGTKLEK